MAKFAAMEVVDVHNILAVQIAAARKGRAHAREIGKLHVAQSGQSVSVPSYCKSYFPTSVAIYLPVRLS